MNPKRSWLLIVRTLLLVAALFLQPIQWVAAQSVPPTANPSAATLTQKAAVYQTLLAKAQRIGSVRVIVGVAMPLPFDPEGDLTSPQAIARQRAAIAGSQQDLLTSLAGETIQTYTRYKTIPFLAMKVDAAALVALNSSGQVVSIEEDSLDRATLASSTTVIGAPGLWTAGYQGAGQTVVILDTGIDASHPFLSGRVVGEACFSNAGGEGGAQTLCPNGQPSQTGNGAANAKTAACLVNGQQMCDHGTHVAGIVAGKGSTFSGVAPDANLIAIQVFTRVDDADFCAPDDSCVVSARSDQLSALEYVLALQQNNANLDIAAVNMSLGGGKYQDQATCDSEQGSRKIAIDNLRSLQIATVIASGNESYTDGLSGPGCISSAVAVGATRDDDNIAPFSNMHDMVDLLAPGVDIESSIVGGGFESYNGTSMATPMVAGAWALLKSINPSATVDEILQQLTSTGVAVSDTRTGGSVTKPRIKLNAAGADPQITTIQPNSGATGAGLTVTIVATNTHFAANTTTVDFGAGIMVNSITVKNATEVAAAIQIAANAQPGVRTVKVTTGAEVVSKADGFTITGTTPAPTITNIQPTNADQGKSLAVTITGANTNFVDGSTEADFGVGITVTNVTVQNATQMVVDLAIAANAEPGERTVELTTGAEVVRKEKGFRVNIPTPPTGNSTLYFDPSPTTLNVGETRTIAVVVSPGNTPINGVQVNGKLDPTHLQLLKVTSNNTVLTEILDPLGFDATSGSFHFGAGILGTTITEPFTLLTLEVKAVAATGAAGTTLKYLSTFPATDIAGPSGSIMEAALDGTVIINSVGNSAVLHGRIDLQGRPAKPASAWSIPLTVELTTAPNSAPQVHHVTTNEEGKFTLEGLIPGVYSLRVKGDHTLGNQIDNVTLAAGVNELFLGTLLEGDVETNRSRNQTVLADFGQLSGSYDRCTDEGGYMPNADLNETDGCVTIEDFGLLSENFNTQGWIVYSSPLGIPAPLPLAQSNALLTFGSSDKAAPVNAPMDLPLFVDPVNGDGVVGLTVHLRYDPALVEVMDVVLTGQLPKVLLKPTVDPVAGSLRFSIGANLGQNLISKVQVATIKVLLKAETGGTALTLVTAQPRDTNIAGANGSIMAGAQGITLRTGAAGTNAFMLFLPTARR